MSIIKSFELDFKNNRLRQKLLRQDRVSALDDIVYAKTNILVVDSEIPEYDKDSGSRRLLELIRLMLENEFGVFLIADKREYKYKSEYIQFYRDLGVVVYEPYLDAFDHLVTRDKFIKILLPNIQFAWLHRADIFFKYQLLFSDTYSVKLIYDMVDFHYLRFFREWKHSGKPKLKDEAESQLRKELQNCKNADHIIVISETDKESLKLHYNNDSKMIVIGNIHEFIKKDTEFKSFSERENLLFVGGFKHLPNIDAVNFLHNDIMPLVWQKYPEIKVMIVGSYPTEEVLKLNSERFVVKGFVKNIEKYYQTARVFIAPLQFGAGIKGKIGQSFEHSLPVVTTEIGAEGFDFGIYKEQTIANSASEIADKIIHLYTDESLWNDVSAQSETIIKPFSIAHINNQLKTLLKWNKIK
jgi:glycosyltransferase involved in cell wall biosynthesis